MTRKNISSQWDRDNRNAINDNFKNLFDDFNNVVEIVSEKAYGDVIEAAKLEWKEPVNSYSDLPSEASEGDTRFDRETGRVYRFNGSEWIEIQQIDASAINEVDNRLTSQLAQTPSRLEVYLRSQGINMNDLDEETRQAILENNNIDINYVLGPNNVKKEHIADMSVSLAKTTVTKRTRNLFDGEYKQGSFYRIAAENALYPYDSPDPLTRIAIVPIQPNKTYTIKVHDTELSDRFSVGITNAYPIFKSDLDEPRNRDNPVDRVIVLREGDERSNRMTTFVNDDNGRYLLIYISAEGNEPRLQVEEGEQSSEYTPGLVIDSTFTEKHDLNLVDLDLMLTESANLFDGKYVEGYLFESSGAGVLYPHTSSSGLNRTAVVPIQPSKTYSLRLFDDIEYMRVGITNDYPVFTDSLDNHLPTFQLLRKSVFVVRLPLRELE